MVLEDAIIKTLKYSSIFKYPLTLREIYKYLLCDNTYPLKLVEQELRKLEGQKKIYSYNKVYSLKKIKKLDYSKKIVCLKDFNHILNKVKKELNFLNKLFFIKFVGITGSVAAKDLSGNYDIDLFFIAQKNFVWISRLFVVLLFKIKGIYKNPYCPNIYISEDSLNWYLKNVYIANEIARLKIVYNKNHTFQRFLQENGWITEYLPNMRFYISKKSYPFYTNLLSLIALPIEVIFYFIEYTYMKPKISTERVSLKKIMFLKKDYKDKILQQFNRLQQTKWGIVITRVDKLIKIYKIILTVLSL